VKDVARFLAGSSVAVSTVIGFPHGYNATATKVFEAERAMDDGATELDMVINISKLLSGDHDCVRADVKAVCDAAHARGAIVKAILENCYLTDAQKETACRLCEEAGADYVKTSTGFGAGGATFADLRLMRRSVSAKVRVKAAGGIRELETALLVRELGGSRFGCTTTAAVLDECAKRTGG
jgi:deoxyribose-phosphate aldolase